MLWSLVLDAGLSALLISCRPRLEGEAQEWSSHLANIGYARWI